MHVDHPQTDVKPEVTDSGSKDRPEGKCTYTILTGTALFTLSAGRLCSRLFSQWHKKKLGGPSFNFWLNTHISISSIKDIILQLKFLLLIFIIKLIAVAQLLLF